MKADFECTECKKGINIEEFELYELYDHDDDTKFIDCPYYISPRSIIVTNEKKAVELTLFSGDLRKYGLTKAMSRTVEKGE